MAVKRARRYIVLATAVLACTGFAALITGRENRWQTGMIPGPAIFLPAVGSADDAIFLFSDADGWGAADHDAATGLSAAGAIVVGVDLPDYLEALRNADPTRCLYLVSDIESLSKQVQRSIGTKDYMLPVLAGAGAGGALALAIAAQTPAATIGGTVAVDPPAAIPLTRELCTPADKTVVPEGMIYDLTEGPLPNPVRVVLTSAAPQDGRDHAAVLQAGWPAISVEAVATGANDSLVAALKPGAATGVHAAPLPLTVLDAMPAHDAMALIISGDGGWRDIDKTMAERLQKIGVPTVGLDALRYFWSEKTPAAIAADLSHVIDEYRAKWGVKDVALIGYSFGADVIPASFLAMDGAHQAMVRQISLLGLSEHSNFQISVKGWFGVVHDAGEETLPDLRRIDLGRVQCVYGRDDTGTACPALRGTAAEVIETKGGHHFDGNYENLANLIVSGLDRRASRDATASAEPGE